MAKFMRLWEQVKHFKVNIMNYDVFLRICAIALAIVHFVLMVAMRLSGRMFLTFVNIFSISLYLTAFYYAGKNRIKLVYYMFVTEILLYSTISVAALGEYTQFSLYCLAVIPFTFLTGYVLDCQNLNKRIFHPIKNVIILCLWYFVELGIGALFGARHELGADAVGNFLRYLNIMINIFCLMFGCGVLAMVAVDHTRTIRENMDEMERLMHEAEASNEAKSAFLANMSHEIRTPMNAICGMADMLLDEKLSEQGREYAVTIKSSGDGLLSIINDILDFSKIESGKMPITPEEYYFASLVHDVMGMMDVRVKDKPVELVAEISDDVPCKLCGDTGRIKQILINIMGNAVKFTHEGTVTLGISWQPGGADSGRLAFRVADTGIGIKREDIDKLFDAFEQVDMKRNRGIEGTGLGLSICKLLVESMDGHISVESEYGKGSTFRFDIVQGVIDATPCEYSKNRKNVVRKQFAVDFKAPEAKVLVVDDNKVNLRVAAGLLKKFGIVPDLVDNGRDCVDMIRSREGYDLVFMDHMMPEMDGIEAAGLIRATGTAYTASLPIIALSANAVKDMEKQFLAGGMNDFLPKPIDMAALSALLRKWLPETVIQELPGA